MRRQQEVFGVPQGMLRRQRLRAHHIQRRTGQPSGVQGLHQGVLIDGGAAAHVHHHRLLGQQGDAAAGEDALRLRRAGQGHSQNFRLRQHLIQLRRGIHGVVGIVHMAAAAGDTRHGLSPHGLHPAGKGRADVTGTQHRDAAAADGAHGGLLVAPIVAVHPLLHGGHLPQQHQRHHDHVLTDGHAVGSGGVGEHHLRAVVQGIVLPLIHAGIGAAEPPQGRGSLQLLGGDGAVDHLILPRPVLGQMALGEIVHGEAGVPGHLLDMSTVAVVQVIRHHCKLSHHEYTSQIFSAQRIPSAAADRMPPA